MNFKYHILVGSAVFLRWDKKKATSVHSYLNHLNTSHTINDTNDDDSLTCTAVLEISGESIA